MGLAGYFCRFIKRFANLSAVRYLDSSENRKFEWSTEMKYALNKLTLNLTSPPVLALPDFKAPFFMDIDASSIAVRAVLSQKELNGKIFPVQYLSRTIKRPKGTILHASEKRLKWFQLFTNSGSTCYPRSPLS